MSTPSRLALLFTSSLLLPLAPARGWAAPRIDPTYPPANDLRAPDRTIDTTGGGAVAVIAYSTSGRTVATAGQDRVIRIWNARTGEQGTGALEKSLEGLGGRVRALAFTAEETLVSVSDDRAVKTWDLATGKPVRSAELPERVDRPVIQPGAADPLIAGVVGSSVKLWSAQTGKEARSLQLGSGKPGPLAFSPDGKVLAAGGDRGSIAVWNVSDGTPVAALQAGKAVRALALSAGQLAAGLADGTVKLWPANPPMVSAAAAAARPGAAASKDQSPRGWRAHLGAVTSVAFSTKGDQLASASGRAIVVWDVASGARLCSQEGHTGPVSAVAFNPNGQKMASAAADRTLRLWTVPLPPLPAEELAKITAAVPARATASPKKRRRVLVFWRADAILHKGGVPAVNQAIELMGKKTGAFEADFTRDYAALDPKVLGRYDALVLNSTAHLTIPDEAKKKALLDYARGGGGVVGIHAAIDMFKGWPEGAEVVGATFGGHPWHPSGTWAVKLDDPKHPLLRAWGGQSFKMHDEFYELAEPYRRTDRHVLMSLDLTDAATAGAKPLHRTDRDFAVSWIKRYGAGRVFYGMFGHIADPLWDPRVLAFYLDGIQYALGDLAAEAPAQN